MRKEVKKTSVYIRWDEYIRFVLPPNFTIFRKNRLFTSTNILSFCNGKAPSVANSCRSRPPSVIHSPASDCAHSTAARSL